LQLRPIQENFVNDCLESFKTGGTYHLAVAPVSFGKTIVSSALMSKAVHQWGAKCLFLAHLTELVVQTVEKFRAVDSTVECGLFMGKSKQVADVTVGTRQTVGKNLESFGAVNLIIIDEVHLYSSQYQEIVDYFLAKNPRLRVLGVTGTPYKLGQGFIYGEGTTWGDLVFQTTMDQMIRLGYLSQYRYKIDDGGVKDDLGKVSKVAGEYNEGELGELMSREVHMASVAKAIEDYAGERKHIIVFAVTIEHAERLAGLLGCFAVHSKLKKEVWRDRVDEFKAGRQRILVNVSQLSIGFDAPCIDCVIFARPTKSPALFTQMAGRGLRVTEGKSDCLMLDLVGNYRTHGLPSNPKVRAKGEKESKSEGEPTAKVCEECLEVIPVGGKVCPACGHIHIEEVEEVDARQKLVEVEAKDERLTLVRWWEKPKVSKMGYHGVLFVAKVEERDKPLFKSASNGTAKQGKIREQLKELKTGDKIEIVSTPYGDWIA